MELETIRGLLASARAASSCRSCVSATIQRHLISRPLDLGALGLMIPMVESAGAGAADRRLARYAPAARAAWGVLRRRHRARGPARHPREANREIVLIAQIETVAGVEHVEEIAAVDGIDMLWIGHFDLTTSLGMPGQFWN